MTITIECLDAEGLLLTTKVFKGTDMLQVTSMTGWPGWFIITDAQKFEGSSYWRIPQETILCAKRVDRG